MGPRADLDAWGRKNENILFLPRIEPRVLSCPSVASSLYRLHYPGLKCYSLSDAHDESRSYYKTWVLIGTTTLKWSKLNKMDRTFHCLQSDGTTSKIPSTKTRRHIPVPLMKHGIYKTQKRNMFRHPWVRHKNYILLVRTLNRYSAQICT